MGRLNVDDIVLSSQANSNTSWEIQRDEGNNFLISHRASNEPDVMEIKGSGSEYLHTYFYHPVHIVGNLYFDQGGSISFVDNSIDGSAITDGSIDSTKISDPQGIIDRVRDGSISIDKLDKNSGNFAELISDGSLSISKLTDLEDLGTALPNSSIPLSKIKDLATTYLRLSGGTMTGAIAFNMGTNASVIKNTTNTGRLNILGGTGGTSGAYLALYGIEHTDESARGEFAIISTSETGSHSNLVGKPNGELTWAGKPVITTANISNQIANLTPAQLKILTSALVASGVDPVTGEPLGGGIGVNDNGKLIFDANNMSTEVFKNMLAALSLPYYLENKEVYLYVDQNAEEDINEVDWDKSIRTRYVATKPFKSIEKAVAFASTRISLGTKNGYIYLKAGSYDVASEISLPQYSSNSGVWVILPETNTARVTISATRRNSSSIFQCDGGEWYLDDLNITLTYHPTTSTLTYFPCILSCGANGILNIRNCNLTYNDDTDTVPDPTNESNTVSVGSSSRLLQCSGGKMRLYPNSNHYQNAGLKSIIWTINKLNPNHSGTNSWIWCESSGLFAIMRSGKTSDTETTKITVRGPFDRFYSGLYTSQGQGRGANGYSVRFKGDGSEGQLKRFALSTGATVGKLTGGLNRSDVEETSITSTTFFPGNEDGTVEESTYCWIKD